MLERFKNYFGKLERLSDRELDRSAKKLVCAEKQNVAQLIAHIAEMSKDVAPGVPRVKDKPARSRYIPSEAIERVHARGNHQCEYKSGSLAARALARGVAALVVYERQPMLSAIRALPILPGCSFGSVLSRGVSPLRVAAFTRSNFSLNSRIQSTS